MLYKRLGFNNLPYACLFANIILQLHNWLQIEGSNKR